VCEDADDGPDREVGDMRAALAATGAHVLAASRTWRRLGLDEQRWRRFAAHWDDLCPDRFAAGSGTSRFRRYGRFVLRRDATWHPLPHTEFRQPVGTNRLFPDVGRDFESLTAQFVADPVFAGLLRLLGEVAAGMQDAPEWLVHVHPFRVIGTVGSRGDATPEGRHQDGVTLVSSLLVARRNAGGGRSSVFDPDGHEILGVTLSEPGTLLVGDDRRTWHSVSPIRPVDPAAPSVRDVLVVTLTGRGVHGR
jgi:hypothetical protein